MPIVIALVVVVLLAIGTLYVTNETSPSPAAPTTSAPESRTETAADVPTPPPTTPTASTPVVPPVDTTLKQALSGTFTTNTTYLTPKRTSHTLDVTLTVDNDVVTGATVRYDGKDSGFSNGHQERFDTAYKTDVIGKKLTDISLARVGGASLTSDSFNEAVKQVVAQATQS
jgi:hypothetical protein